MENVQPVTHKDAKNIISGSTKGMEQKFNDTAHLIREKTSEGKEIAQDLYSDLLSIARRKSSDAVDASTGFIKENPIATVCGAAALGAVVGFLLARR